VADTSHLRSDARYRRATSILVWFGVGLLAGFILWASGFRIIVHTDAPTFPAVTSTPTLTVSCTSEVVDGATLVSCVG
jgi:hypothetical protein